MKKLKNKDYINISLLILIFALILFSIVGFDYVNGSTVDWDSQHWIFPEYFRTLFYDTKDLFPSFAFNIGGGQNIFNFSYYGLLSPFVLFSYLLPFVNMVNYIEVVMILSILASIILLYCWLRTKFEIKYAFFGSILFLLAGPLIYHTHRHLMFINYMPFLIMALFGVDSYFNNNRKTLLAVSVFLIVMSSYYYSVCSILAIVAYGIYKYIEINKKVTFKKFIFDGLKFIFPILVGFLMSAVLIFPTFYALINGRADITSSVDFLGLLFPKFNINEILYNSYTIGVTSIFIIAIIYGYFTKNRNYKFLSTLFLIIILFPFIIYLFSGFMYVRGKVLIPFLPLAILVITLFLDKLNLKINKIFFALITILSVMQVIVHIESGNYVFILDVVIALLSVFLYFKYHNKNYIFCFASLCALVCCLVSNYSDKLVSKDDISKQHNTYNYNILNPILENDNNIYRVGNDIMNMKNINRVVNSNYYLPSVYSSLENQNYYNLSVNSISNEMENRISTAIMSTKNILFNTYMSTKYMITDGIVPIGYRNIDNSNVYVNDNVLPIGYATTKILNKEIYDSLSYPDNAYALATNLIVEGEGMTKFESDVKEEKLEYEASYKYLSIDNNDDKYIIESEDNGNVNLKLKKTYSDKILFIRFNMEYSESCLIGDTSITINGVKNTLSCRGWTYHNKNYTFEYAISSNEPISEIDVVFEKGKYIISDINVYSLEYSKIKNFVNSVDEFVIDKRETKGDVVVGDINVSENGYFVISIPYEEKGFSIYVNDKLVKYEKVDDTFIGFKINEGYHQIKIMYTSPYLLEGMIVSIFSHMMLIPIIYSDLFKNRKKRV